MPENKDTTLILDVTTSTHAKNNKLHNLTTSLVVTSKSNDVANNQLSKSSKATTSKITDNTKTINKTASSADDSQEVSINLNFLDEDEGNKNIGTQKISGALNDNVTSKIKDIYNEYKSKGYEIDGDNDPFGPGGATIFYYKADPVILTEDKNDESYSIGLKHSITQYMGDPYYSYINKGYTGKNPYTGEDFPKLDRLSKTFTRTINIHYQDGTPTKTITQTSPTFYRNAKIDNITNDVTYSHWETESKYYDGELHAGYSPGQEDFDEVRLPKDAHTDKEYPSQGNYGNVWGTIPLIEKQDISYDWDHEGLDIDKDDNFVIDVYVGHNTYNFKYEDALTGEPLQDVNYDVTRTDDNGLYPMQVSYHNVGHQLGETSDLLYRQLIPSMPGHQFTGVVIDGQEADDTDYTPGHENAAVKAFKEFTTDGKDHNITLKYTPLSPIEVDAVDPNNTDADGNPSVIASFIIPTTDSLPKSASGVEKINDDGAKLGLGQAYSTEAIQNIPGYEYTGNHSDNISGFVGQLQKKNVDGTIDQNPIRITYEYQVIPGQENVAAYSRHHWTGDSDKLYAKLHGGFQVNSDLPYANWGLETAISNHEKQKNVTYFGSINKTGGKGSATKNTIVLAFSSLRPVTVNYYDLLTGEKLPNSDGSDSTVLYYPNDPDTELQHGTITNEDGSKTEAYLVPSSTNWESTQKSFDNYVFVKVDRTDKADADQESNWTNTQNNATSGKFGVTPQEVNYYYYKPATEEKEYKSATRIIHYVGDENNDSLISDMPKLKKDGLQSLTLEGTYYVDSEGKRVAVKFIDKDGNVVASTVPNAIAVVDSTTSTPTETWNILKENNISEKDNEYDFNPVNVNNNSKITVTEDWSKQYDNVSTGDWFYVSDKNNVAESLTPSDENWQTANISSDTENVKKLNDIYLIYKQKAQYNVHYIDLGNSDKTTNLQPKDGQELTDHEVPNIGQDTDNQKFYIGDNPDESTQLWQAHTDNNQGYEDLGFALVQSDDRLAHQKLTKGVQDQYVYLIHKNTVVPPSDTPNYPTNVKKDNQKATKETATHTVKYFDADTLDANGKPTAIPDSLAKTVTQNITWTRYAVYDNVDGKFLGYAKLGKDGQPEKDEYGNTIVDSSLDNDNSSWTITQTQDGKTIAGNTAQFDKVPSNDLTKYGYKLARSLNNSNYDAKDSGANVAAKTANFGDNTEDDVYYFHDIVPVTSTSTDVPKNEDGNPVVDPKSLTKETKRTINFVAADDKNNVLHDPITQSVKYTGTAYVDRVTGKQVNAIEEDGRYVQVNKNKDPKITWTSTSENFDKNINGFDKVSMSTIEKDNQTWYLTKDDPENKNVPNLIPDSQLPGDSVLTLKYKTKADYNVHYIDLGNSTKTTDLVPTDGTELTNHEVVDVGKDNYVGDTPDESSKLWAANTTDGEGYEDLGYILVQSDDNLADQKLTDGMNDQYVYLKHRTKTKESTPVSVTRHIYYWDATAGKKLDNLTAETKPITQTVNYNRIEVLDAVTGAHLGYTQDANTKTVDSSLDKTNGWFVTNGEFASVDSPDLTGYGYKLQRAENNDLSSMPAFDTSDKGKTVAAEAVSIKNGNPVDGSDVNVYYFHDTEPVTETAQVKETIDYTYKNGPKAGQEANNPYAKTITYTRKGNKDKVTGDITYNKAGWQPDTSLEDKTSPTHAGYTVDYSTVLAPKVDTSQLDSKKPLTIEEHVTYSINPQRMDITYIDDTTGKTLKVDSRNGQSNGESGYSTKTSIEDYKKQGYVFVSDSTEGRSDQSNLKFDNDNNPDNQHYVVHLKHDTTPVSQFKTVNETVHYKYKDTDNTAHDDYEATPLTFTQTGTKDKVTGKTTWNDDWTSNQKFGEVKSPAIKGYKPDKDKIASVTINHDSDDVDVTVLYTKNPPEEKTDSKTVKETIHYVYKDGTKAHEDYVATPIEFTRTGEEDPVTDKISWNEWSPMQSFAEVVSPTIAGYTPDQDKISSISVDHNSKDIVKTVVYKKTPAPKTYTWTVEYKTTDGKVIKAPVTVGKDYKNNDNFDVTKESPNIYTPEIIKDGKTYKLVETESKNLSGKFDNSDETTTLTYQEVEYHKVTVHYVDEKGNQIHDDTPVLSNAEKGTNYDTTATKLPEITKDGKTYEFKEVKSGDPEKGTISGKDINVTYIYKLQTPSQPQPEKYNTTVKYVDKDGKELIPSVNGQQDIPDGNSFDNSGKKKDTITVGDKTYKLIKEKNVSGTISGKAETTTYIYEEVVTLIIPSDDVQPTPQEYKVTVHYEDEDGHEIKPTVDNGSYQNGASYDTTSQKLKTIEYDGHTYVLTKSTGNETGTINGNNEDVIYIYKLAENPTPVHPTEEKPETPKKVSTKKVEKSETPAPVKATKEKVITPIKKSSVVTATPIERSEKPSTHRFKRSAVPVSDKQLPQTGEKDGAAAALLGTILAGVGLIGLGIGKRRKRDE